MTEEKFVTLLEKQLKKNFDFLTKREIGVGYGVADLVLFKLDPKKCLIRKNNKQYNKIENEDAFKIFDFLPEINKKKKADINYLSNELNIPKSSLRYKYLKKLSDDGFIKIENDQYYFKVNGWMPIANEIIAIEAKLKDWHRGFLQANRYKSFANKTFLAMPLSQGHVVDRALLKKHNVGLILFDATTKEIKIISPKKEKPLNKYKFNLAAEFVLTNKILSKFSSL